MTVLHEIKPMEACTNITLGDNNGAGGSGIGCCTRGTISDISIDESSSSNANNTLHDEFEANFKHCKRVDIEFENIRYTVSRFAFAERKFVTKEILHGVSGAFRSGELTAIMGPSGSGKSTLLNVMTGYRSTGVTGSIHVNGNMHSINSNEFRAMSCYIFQNDLLRPQLTVKETMLLATHLKLGFKVTIEHKMNLIQHILSLLGLEHRMKVCTAKLSGGQRKRLAVALELISNPPVLYLDEPTTGLDSSSCSQCIALLKKLASQGHTIVCTIHQPSAMIFEMFDKLYAVVDGNCIYQGPVRELIPFLTDQDLICPSYHNPADYLLEIAVGEHDCDLSKLIHAANKKYHEDVDLNQMNRVSRLISKIQENIENGASNNMKKLTNAVAPFPAFDYIKPAANDLAMEELDSLNGGRSKRRTPAGQSIIQPASFTMQYLLLMKRILTCSRRNYFLLLARLISHLFIGVVFGYLYRNIGTNATTVLGNYVYLYGTILLLVYTGKMAVVLTFPLEIDVLKREHFNRWYSLGPYFLTMLSFEVPFQSICAILYMSFSLLLTGNIHNESFRIYYFLVLGILASLSAQAWGFFVGATLPTKLAVFAGPILAVLFSVFGFCTRYIDITPLFRWMWHISYFRAGFHGLLNSIYGFERSFLSCPGDVMYCHFRSPKVFLNYMMISDVSMFDCVRLMSISIAVMHVLTLVTLWHKLNKR